jgi:hypothetical protein
MSSHGLFGVTYPKLGVLVELLIGRYRGLLPYSPILILAAMGFAAPTHRPERLTAAAIVVYYLLFVSSYQWWQGGSSFGSRHLAPMLPFLCLPLGWIADARPRITAGVFALSLFFMAVVTAVQPKPSERLPNPWAAIWHAFEREHVSANNTCPNTGRIETSAHEPLVSGLRHDAFNVGMLLGGKGHRSLIPLWTLWLLSAWALWRATRGDRPESSS